MPFINTIDLDQIGADVRAMYARQQAHYGYVPNYAHVFCHRPQVMQLWAQLQSGIKRHVDPRRYELATFAAACALRSTLCSLAHGKALLKFFSSEDVQAIARGSNPASLTSAEVAMLVFARKVARDATSVTREDVERLKAQGFSDGEIFDVAAIAAARAFWTKLIDALGVEADVPARSADESFTQAMTVGRPARYRQPVRLSESCEMSA